MNGFLFKVAMSTLVTVSLVAASSLLASPILSAASIEKEQSKKAIIVVSFGTTFAEACKSCIESVENRISETFPDYDVFRAFTSKFVIKRLAERDQIYVSDLDTVLTKLQAEGYNEVIIQTTHLTPGEEYDKKVLATVEKFRYSFANIAIGRPVLYYNGTNDKPNDFAIALEALKKQMPGQLEDKTVVFMGHGSPHQHNPAYQSMQEHFDAIGLQAVVGVVEESDYPNLEDVLRILDERNVKKVILMPMMVVAGDHANNDMAGDDKDSWKNQFIAKGYEVETYLHGLGENKAFQDIYVEHVRDAMNGL